MQKKKRMNLFIPVDLDLSLGVWSEKFDLSKTVLINLSIRAGLDAIIRAISPADALTPEKWAQIVSEMIKTGQPVVLPDGTVVGEDLETVGNSSANGR